MKKSTCLIIVVFFIINSVSSQITKGNWMVGGNLNYTKSKSTGSAASNSNVRDFTLLPTAGYFVFDKGVIGIKSELSFVKESYPQTNGTVVSNSQNFLGIGPFARYYFLPKDKRINTFSDGSILYKETVSKSSGNTTDKFKTLNYSLSCGMVIFLNTSVGVEFSVGYYSSKAIDFDAKGEDFKFGIGFQIHLEKEND